MNGAERDPRLVFRMEVADAALAEDGIGIPDTELKPVMPVLRIINQFLDEKVGKALKEKDTLKALEALGDLRVVLSNLCETGHNYQSMLAIIDDALAQARKMMRDSLIRDCLDPATPAERVEEIKEALIDIAQHGGWPNWREELDDAIWERAC
jgi:hypothetical protein